jgi:hypothetical protein
MEGNGGMTNQTAQWDEGWNLHPDPKLPCKRPIPHKLFAGNITLILTLRKSFRKTTHKGNPTITITITLSKSTQKKQPTKENPASPSCKDPKATPTPKTSPLTIPTIAEPQNSPQPRLLAAPSPNTHNAINPHKISPPCINSLAQTPPLPKIPAKTQKKDTS